MRCANLNDTGPGACPDVAAASLANQAMSWWALEGQAPLSGGLRLKLKVPLTPVGVLVGTENSPKHVARSLEPIGFMPDVQAKSHASPRQL